VFDPQPASGLLPKIRAVIRAMASMKSVAHHACATESEAHPNAIELVRDAITLLIEGDDEFNGGYNKGVRDAMSMINEDILATRISYDAESIAAHLCSKLDTMIVNQNTKEKKNGKAKK
jgi:hypothetical protein